MSPSQIVFLLAAQLVLVSCQLPQEETETSQSSSVTETVTELATEQTILGEGLEYFLGDSGNKLIFDEDSPIQYAINFDYGPIISSITTILQFIFSTSSPGYVLATYDYSSLLSRLSPGPVREMALQYTSGYTQTAIILLSSLLSGFAILQVLRQAAMYIFTQHEEQDVTEVRTGARSLKQLDRRTEDVLMAGENLDKMKEKESFDSIINWLNKLVVQSKGTYDSSF